MRGSIAARALLAAATATVLLSGCTQVAQFRQVAGDEITSVGIATNNVLVDQGVAVLVAPVCSATDPGYTCTGSTLEGGTIESTAQGTSEDDLSLNVKVDGQEIYSGTVSDVIEKAGQL